MCRQLLFSGFLVLVFFISTFKISAQDQTTVKDYSEYPHWIDMMQDKSVNFYEVQQAFEAYWENREVTKGSGWKPYKRWEWWTERHVYLDGTRHEPDKVYNAYMDYIQKNPQAKDGEGDWTNLGPIDVPAKGYEGLGRINAVAFHPTDEDILYIGAPAGGCWRYDATTAEWTSTTDLLPTLGVSAIVVDWNNPTTVYIGTGDRDAGDAAGLGVFRSLDEGQTWELWNNGMGNRTVGRMIQHPTDPDIMYAATSGGLYKTIDAGEHWNYKTSYATKEVVFKPGDPSTLYAGGNGGFYKSIDDGETWVQITSGIPNGSRSVIAVTPADPEIVYCLLSTSDSYKGIYRSTNSGNSFTEMSTSPNIMSWGCNGGSGGQAWYDLDVAVSPNDKNVIYAGGVNCFKSVDGGTTWDISSHWWGDCSVPAVHADLHVLEYNPLNDRLYAGNDGGIYFTANDGTTWPEITDGLPISQVYRIGQSKTDIDKVINGYQDNGTSTYFGNNNWQTSYGGDGMECAFDHEDAAYSYATVYYGDIYRLFNNGSSHKVGGSGAHGMNESGGWITPYCLHEGNSDIMFGGYKNIWRAEGVKTNSFTWEKISDDGSGDIDVVEHSPADHNLFFYARNGQLYRSFNVMDDMPEWANISTGIPGSANVFDVECHPLDEDVVYATRGSKVYVSNNKGNTWEDISGSLPDINMNSLAAYVNSADGLYVGSDAGVYYRDASMDDWVMFSNGLPVDASVNEIEIYHNPDNPAEDVIRAGTYGRGLWSSTMWYGDLTVNFEASETSTAANCAIDFYDLTAGTPTEWMWEFEGGNPATSTDKNPVGITYDIPGTYDVTLSVTNPEGSNSVTLSDYITVTEASAPEVNFIASDSITCSGKVVYLTDLSTNCPASWAWAISPSTITYLEGTSPVSQNPVVTFDDGGVYSITLTVSNGAGSNNMTKTDYINVGGIAIPFEEDFESGNFDAKSWTIQNPDFNVTWDISEVGGNGPGNQAAFLNHYEYVVPPGQRDQLISPVLTLPELTTSYLSFQYAYAVRHQTITDSLIVKITDNCGENWTRIFEVGEDGSGSYATHEIIEDPFYPDETEDWCGSGFGADCVILDLTEWEGKDNVQIMFETYNHYSNNLFIDNIVISPATELSEYIAGDELKIFPNPGQGFFNVVVPSGIQVKMVQVFDMQGAVVETLRVQKAENHFTFNISDSGKGVYMIRIEHNQGVYTQRLIIR